MDNAKLNVHSNSDEDERGGSDEHDRRGGDRDEPGGRKVVAAPHGSLYGDPPEVAADDEHEAAGDGRQRQDGRRRFHVEGVDELAHGDSTGKETERRAHPGEERALVGEGEAVIGFDALVIADPPPRHGHRTSLVNAFPGHAGRRWPPASS